jgi:hypothetical protein
MASPQESYVQNRNPSQNISPLTDFLDQAFARAVQCFAAAGRSATDPDTMLDGPPVPVAVSTGGESYGDERTVELLLDEAELARVLREPAEWVLALAYRLAAPDPVDLSAVLRVRHWFSARLVGQPATLRPADLLTVAGLLVSALDPAIVVRALSETLSDGIAAALGPEPPRHVDPVPVPRRVDPVAGLRHAPSGPHRWGCRLRPRTR